jgi:hypothetical protein
MAGGRGTQFSTGAITQERIGNLLSLEVDGLMLDDPSEVTGQR